MKSVELFQDFDFDLLGSPDFREDSVREELVAPLLKELGYSASGEHAIVRSKRLEHPFVSIGTKPHKISIIPDYVLYVAGTCQWILDAKSPTEEIHTGKNVEQAFSYAIHRDIRAKYYALCNGREFILFSIAELAPVLSFRLAEMGENWERLYRTLSPLALTRPELLDYRPDFGIALVKLGFRPVTTMHFPAAALFSFGRVSDDLFSAGSNVNYGEGPFAASFDLDRERFEKLLTVIPTPQAELLRRHLTAQPYFVHMAPDDPVVVNLEAKLSVNLHRKEDQSFIPLEVENVSEAGI